MMTAMTAILLSGKKLEIADSFSTPDGFVAAVLKVLGPDIRITMAVDNEPKNEMLYNAMHQWHWSADATVTVVIHNDKGTGRASSI